MDYSLIDEFWNKLKSKNTELILQTPQSLENLKKKFREKGVGKIILFGSKARGDFRKTSDTDIAIDGSVPLDFIGNCDVVNMNKCDPKILEKIKKEGFEI